MFHRLDNAFFAPPRAQSDRAPAAPGTGCSGTADVEDIRGPRPHHRRRALRSILAGRSRNALFAIRRRLETGLKPIGEAGAGELVQALDARFVLQAIDALSTFILMRDNAVADELASALSTYLRISLGAPPRGWGRLGDEIAMTERYFQIEALQFPARAQLCWQVADDLLSVRVPSFLLKSLVRASLRGAGLPGLARVRVSVSVRRAADRVVVRVREDRPSPADPSVAAELEAIGRRLHAVYGSGCRFRRRGGPGGGSCLLSLPLMKP